MNLEAFEKQAEKAAAESKTVQSETKEEREIRDKNPPQTRRSLQGISLFHYYMFLPQPM